MRGGGMGEGRQTERDRRVNTRNERVWVCMISTRRGTIILLYMIEYRGKSYARQKTDCE